LDTLKDTKKIRTHLHKVCCANCGKEERIEIDDNGKIITPNWKYFGKVCINACATSKFFYRLDGKDFFDKKSWTKIPNTCYDPKAKKKMVEYWEEIECKEK